MSFNTFIKIDDNSEEKWFQLIEDKLATKLTKYLNHLLRNDL